MENDPAPLQLKTADVVQSVPAIHDHPLSPPLHMLHPKQPDLLQQPPDLQSATKRAQREYKALTTEQVDLELGPIAVRSREVFGTGVDRLLTEIVSTTPIQLIDKLNHERGTMSQEERIRLITGIQTMILLTAKTILDNIPKYPCDLPWRGNAGKRDYGCVTNINGFITSLLATAVISPILRDNPRWEAITNSYFLERLIRSLYIERSRTHEDQLLPKSRFDIDDIQGPNQLLKNLLGALQTRIYLENSRNIDIQDVINWRNPNGSGLGYQLLLTGEEYNWCLRLLETRESAVALFTSSLTFLKLTTPRERLVMDYGQVEFPEITDAQGRYEALITLFQIRRLSIAMFSTEALSDQLADESFRILNPDLFQEASQIRSSTASVNSVKGLERQVLIWGQALYISDILTGEAYEQIRAGDTTDLFYPMYVSAREKSVWSTYLKVRGIDGGVFPPKEPCTLSRLTELISSSDSTGRPCDQEVLDIFTGDVTGAVIGIHFPGLRDIPFERREPIDFIKFANKVESVFRKAGLKVVGFHTKYLDREAYPNYCAIHFWLAIPNSAGSYSLFEVRVMPEEYVYLYQAQHISHNELKEGIPPEKSFTRSHRTLLSEVRDFSPRRRSAIGDGLIQATAAITINAESRGNLPITPIPHIRTLTGSGGTIADILYQAHFGPYNQQRVSPTRNVTMDRSLPIEIQTPLNSREQQFLRLLVSKVYLTLGHEYEIRRQRRIIDQRAMSQLPQTLQIRHSLGRNPYARTPPPPRPVKRDLQISLTYTTKGVLGEVLDTSLFKGIHADRRAALVPLAEWFELLFEARGTEWLQDRIEALMKSKTVERASILNPDNSITLKHILNNLSVSDKLRILKNIREFLSEVSLSRPDSTGGEMAGLILGNLEYLFDQNRTVSAFIKIIDIALHSYQTQRLMDHASLTPETLSQFIRIASSASSELEILLIRYFITCIENGSLTPEMLFTAASEGYDGLTSEDNQFSFGFSPHTWTNRFALLLADRYPAFYDDYLKLFTDSPVLQ